MSFYYNIDRVTINGIDNILDNYELIVVAKPGLPYNENDKYIIDQFIMNGGKVFWLIDAVGVFTDSLAKYGTTFGFYNDVNLNDQLFQYGIRINPILVQDIQSAIIPVNTSLPGSPSKFVPAPWYYHPLIIGLQEHPITNNLSMIKAEYINSIDTVGENNDVKKSVLLRSSRLSKIKNIPARISLSEVMEEIPENYFTTGYVPLAILLEGQFKSNFINRNIKNYTSNTNKFKELSVPNKMLIVADGDIIRNNVRERADGRMIEPLGYDRYTNQIYGNKEFIINAVNYLLAESELINLRSRTLEMRLLDNQKIIESRFLIQVVNIIIPIALLIIFGIIYNFYRKKVYATK